VRNLADNDIDDVRRPVQKHGIVQQGKDVKSVSKQKSIESVKNLEENVSERRTSAISRSQRKRQTFPRNS
jgi:hypothetical protein